MKEVVEDKGRVRPVVEGDFQCDKDGNSTRYYEILSIVGVVNGSTKISYISKKDVPIGISITDENYWYSFQVISVPKGDKGDKGDDGVTPIFRISTDGQSIEISTDNGETWSLFERNFNKLRVIGYLDNINLLPKTAIVGDIYGVWNQEAQEDEGAYELYINTIKDWLLDYTITKVYDYDTELPSSASDGTTVLIPVTDLTLDKEKVDGYKVYKFNLANNGWVMILNTAEIYTNKEDIVNKGDNVYALVQGATEGTYELYKRSVGWVKFGTNASISYQLVQNILQGTATNVPSGKAVKDAIEAEQAAREQDIADVNTAISELDIKTTENLDAFKQEVKDTYGDYTENPEFVRAVTDNEHKVLCGIQKDGNFYFGAGCPQQIKDYVDEQLKVITDIDDFEERIEKLQEIIEWFEHLIEIGGLEALIFEINQRIDAVDAAKVDKEEGKSLIDAEYANGVHHIESPEFAEVKLDAEERIIEATYKDGTRLLPAGVTIHDKVELDAATVTTVSNPEFMAIWLDSSDRIILGIKDDADVVFGYGVPSQIKAYVDEKVAEVSPEGVQDIIDFIGNYLGTTTLQELLDKKIDGEYIESPEFIEAKTDAEDKLIEGTQIDGTKVFGGDVKVLGSMDIQDVRYTVVSNSEWLAAWVDATEKILFGFKADGKTFVGDADFLEDIKANKESIEEIKALIESLNLHSLDIEALSSISLAGSPEWIDVKIGADDKIIEGITSEGIKKINIPVDNGAAIVSNEESPEYLETLIDAKKRLIAGRRKDGTLVENVGIESPTISNLQEEVNKALNNGIVQNANALNNLDSVHNIVALQREAKALSDEINSLKTVKNGNTQDIVTVVLRNSGKKKLILNLHKRNATDDAQSNDVFLPNANDNFSDVRVFTNDGVRLPYKVINSGDYDIVPTMKFGHNAISKPWQNSDGDILYSGSVTSYKPGISTDDGETWTVLEGIKDGYTGNVYISFLDADDTIFIGDGPLLYRSEYPYTTKELVLDISEGDGMTYTGCHILSTDICQHPDGELFLGSYQLEKAIRIFKSTDGGKTWIKVHHSTDYQHVHSIICDTNQTPAVIYAGCDDSNGLYYSKDKGITWHDINYDGNLIHSIDYGVIYSDPAFRLLGGETQHQGGHSIIRTTDDATFTPVLSCGQACYMCKKLGDTLFAGLLSTLSHKTTQIAVSDDDGLSWRTAYSTMGVARSSASDGFRLMQKLKKKGTDKGYIFVGCQDYIDMHQNDLLIYADNDSHFAEIVVDVPEGVTSVRIESGYLISDNKEVYNDSVAENKLLEIVPLSEKLLYESYGNTFYKGDFSLHTPIRKLGNIVKPIIDGDNSLSLESAGLPLTDVELDISQSHAITISFWLYVTGDCVFDVIDGLRFNNSAFSFNNLSAGASWQWLFSQEKNTLLTAKKFDVVLDFDNDKALLYTNGTSYSYADLKEVAVNYGNYKNNKKWKLLEAVSITSDAYISGLTIRNGAISTATSVNEYYNNLDDNVN